MTSRTLFSRRQVLATLGVAGSMLALGSRARAATKPARLRLAFFGVGGRGRANVQNLTEQEFVAFADVDDVRAAATYREFPDVPRYRDYRRLLDRHADSIDGVVISTPDHLHLAMALAAIEAGKHVYLEKPLAPTLAECGVLQQAAAKARVRTQLGLQGHSFEALRVLREWIEAGAVGQVEEVVLWSDRMRPEGYIGAASPAAAMPVPSTLDWEAWLGSRLARPYSDRYLPGRWRNWWDFGAGALVDIGVHMFDVLQFALDLGDPDVVTAESSDRLALTAPQWTRVEWVFPAGQKRGAVRVSWIGGFRAGLPVKPEAVPHLPAELVAETENAITIVGREGTLFIPDMRASVRPRIYPLAREREFLAAVPSRTLPRPKGGHYQDWIDAVVENHPASTPFSYGGPLTEKVLLGTLAQRTGAPVRWNPATRTIKGNAAAGQLVEPSVRGGWRKAVRAG